MRTIIVSVFVISTIISGCSEQKGVQDWKNGAVLCDASIIYINLGHEDDPEVSKLFAKAKECSNYNEYN